MANAAAMKRKNQAADVARYADMLSAMGTEPRLRIVRLLLSAHPEGISSSRRREANRFEATSF